MRFVHTSDWHLGRLFHGLHLTDDQAFVLDQFVDFVADAKPDAVVIAGDVYDRAVPPPEAVALLDEVLSRLALDVGVPVLAIAGNHDSPERLAFGERLLAGRGVHVVGGLEGWPRPVTVDARDGRCDFYLLPYSEPARVRAATGDEDLAGHDDATAHLVAAARAARRDDRPAVLVAHAFVAGGEESESERPLAVGGSGAVAASSLDGFDYVALGHLHRPQRVGADTVRYSGSLLKYSFSEATHAKSVTLVEIGADRAVTHEQIALAPRRDVRVLRGTLSEILDGDDAGSRDDYVLAELTDRGALLDPMGRLREVYPNCLHVDRRAFLAEAAAVAGGGERADPRRRTETEMFAAFVREVTGDELTGDESDAFAEIVDAMRAGEREASS